MTCLLVMVQSKLTLMEFFLFDVILNRDVKPADTDVVADPDKIEKALAYNDNDIDQRSDCKYRSAIAFLPGAEAFCCARERRKSNCVDTSLNSLVPLNMSWLRITEADNNSLKFGEDGHVWYFCWQLPVLDWRVTAGRGGNHNKCSIYRAVQCADHDGPRMPPI
jgi:hypothetical protein